MANTGIRQLTTVVGGYAKRIWYSLNGTTPTAELMSIDDAGNFKCGKTEVTISNEDTIGVALALKSLGASPAQAGNGTAITFGIAGNYNTERVGAQIHTVKTNYDIDCDLVFSTRHNGIIEESGRFLAGGFFSAKSLTGTGNRALYSNAYGVLTNTSSDERVKKNVKNITETMDVLEVLKNIRGITYNWDNTIEGYENMGEQEEIGVIAQEIEQYIPQIVGENQTGYKSVDYAKLVAFLIETNKALLEKMEILESKVV